MSLSLFVLLISVPIATLHAQESPQPLDPRYRDLIGKSVSARVTKVTDGDTLEVVIPGERRAIEIRLFGVDTPEKNESFSARARTATRVLTFDRDVVIHASRVERNGRLAARVTANGMDVGLELIRQGLACHETAYSSDETLAKVEAVAKKQGLGIWGRGVPKPRCVARKDGSLHAAAFHGNTSSKIYHSASCRNYMCKNCVAVFATEAEAKAAGYKPAADCLR